MKKTSKKSDNKNNENINESAPTGSEKQYERIQSIGSVITSSKKKKIY